MRKSVIAIGLVVLIAVAYLGYSHYIAPSPQATPTPFVKEVEDVVSASGVVIPARRASLSFEVGGRVEEIMVEEGDEVKAGQELIRLDDTGLRHAVQGAQAALEAAKAELAALEAGARPQEIAVAEAALKAAEAQLAQVKAGPKPEQIAAAKAAMDKAASVLRVAQAEYDRIASLPGAGASPQAIALEQATADYEAAKANYEALVRGATPEEVALAEAQVEEARARLQLLLAGPRPEEVAAAKARVRQAEAALKQAEAALEKAVLRAPFTGTVARIAVREGEIVAPGRPVVFLGDLKTLRVETTDLNEVDIARVKVGQKVDITFDALPEKKLLGHVVRIAPMATTEEGGTNYTVVIELEELDPALRWGMTAFVDILVE